MVLSPDLAFLVTVLWVVGMANAVNLIDGLDGLAAGVVGIAAFALFIYSNRLSGAGLLEPENMSSLTMAITCGVCVGILPHNFSPAKVFMGDGGALLLGLLMAAATISVGGRTADTLNKNQIPGDFRSPFVTSGLRIGTPAVTTAGMGEGEIASLIGRALRYRASDAVVAEVREAVTTLCSKFTPYAHLAG